MKGCLVISAVAFCLFVLLTLRACSHHAATIRDEAARAHAKAQAAMLADVRAQRAKLDEAGVPIDKPPDVASCVTAIASQSDPAKLATLGSRQANPRLKRIIYYLAVARDTGADLGIIIDQAQLANSSFGTLRAPLVKASLLRNLKICDGLAMLDPENRASLRRGNAPIVHRGPYTGQIAEVDHIVPLAQAPEIGNELANLEMLPATLNRAKSDKVGERQLDLAKRFRAAGLISADTMANIQAKFVPSGTGTYELKEP